MEQGYSDPLGPETMGRPFPPRFRKALRVEVFITSFLSNKNVSELLVTL